MTISKLTKIIGAVVIVGYIASLAVSTHTLNNLKVGGPTYQKIALGKDLIADVLPPPAYLIEAYLEATRALQVQLASQDAATETADAAERAAALKKLNAEYESRHEFWLAQDLDPAVKNALVIESYEPGKRFWQIVNERFIPAITAKDTDNASEAFKDVTKAFTEHRAKIDRVVQLAQANNQQTADKAHSYEKISLAITFACAISVLFLIMASIAGVLLKILKPMNRIRNVMNDLASGRLDIGLEYTQRTDEIGEMARAVDVFRLNAIERNQLDAAMQETRSKEVLRQQTLDRNLLNFKETITRNLDILLNEIGGLRGASAALLTAADKGSAEANSSANACADAASSAQAVAAATEELNASIRELASQANLTSSIVGETTQKAQSTDQEVGKLTEAVNKIDSVITLIRTIAQQTNLLALNATIESARAGEAGRGFAVVAAEVKALSEQTAKATEEIAQQIQTVQLTTETAATAIRDIGSKVGEIHSLATSVAAAVEEQGAATSDIARNVHVAATGSQQAAESSRIVTDIAKLTGEEAQRVSAASDQLQAVSAAVSKAVQGFIEAVSSDLQERRAAYRYSVDKVIVVSKGGERIEVRAHNVSQKGMKISAVKGLRVGDTIVVDFGFDRAQAKVSWTDNQGAGLEFVKALSEDPVNDARWRDKEANNLAA